MASKLFRIPDGSGLVDVLVISASVLDSITWLKPLEEPVINIPPIINSKKTIEDKLPPASKYPKKAPITTRLESLSFKREIYNEIKWRLCINKDIALTHIISMFI